MDSFRRLKNEGVFPEKDQIYNRMLDALRKTRDEDMMEMVGRVSDFINQIGAGLAERLEFEDAEEKVYFKFMRTGTATDLAELVQEAYGKLTPDTVRAYFLMTIVPQMLDDTLVPFRTVVRDETRHTIAPVVAGLFYAARKAARSIRDGDLRREAKELLEEIRIDEIKRWIRSKAVRLH